MKIIQVLFITSLVAFGGVLHASDFSDVGPESLFYDMDYNTGFRGADTDQRKPVDTNVNYVYMHTDVIPEALLEPYNY